MSITGIYEYDPSIFDYFHVPFEEEIPPVHYDKDFYVQRILTDAMDLELVYPNPQFMKRAIKWWSLAHKNNWQRLAEALEKHYNPIENYNRSETWTDTDTRTENWTDTEKRTEEWTHGASIDDTGTVDVKRTDNLKQKTDGTTSTETTGDESGNQTETNAAIGYNSDTWKDNTKTTTDHESDTSSTSDTTVDQTVENTGTQDSLTTNDLNRNLEENSLSSVDGSNGRVGSSGGSVTHTGNVSGNIGVTTSQQMVLQEIELRQKYNLVDIVVRDFIETFCILVY
jgi:hypothetical protein